MKSSFSLTLILLAGKSGNCWKIKLLEHGFSSAVVLQKKIPQYNKQDEKQELFSLDAGWKQSHCWMRVNVVRSTEW